jgi:uncharacterized cupredoxin-like copper-binding protein
MKYRLFTLASLAMMTMTATQGAAETAPARVVIVLANFSFTPSAIQLKAGHTVTLHFDNQGSGGHDFTAPEFFKAATMDATTRAKLGKKGNVSLEKGTAADITLTPKAGTYKAKCSHFLHAGFGMTGTITVS